MKRRKLHTQEWRDFQPVPDAESSPQRFKAALTRAEERVKQKGRKVVAESLVTAMAAEVTTMAAESLVTTRVASVGLVNTRK